MSIPVIAQGIVQAGRTYGPAVLREAENMLTKATGKKVNNLQAVEKYVGASPERLSVVAGALARAGMRIDDLMPADLVGMNPALQQIRRTLMVTANSMQGRFDAGSDNSLSLGIEGDIIRKRRVQTALRVYGSEEAYFLCHPNGGIPRGDFAWYKAVINNR